MVSIGDISSVLGEVHSAGKSSIGAFKSVRSFNVRPTVFLPVESLLDSHLSVFRNNFLH